MSQGDKELGKHLLKFHQFMRGDSVFWDTFRFLLPKFLAKTCILYGSANLMNLP